MIRCTVHEKGGMITGFECKGHAGFAESGQDIVCAAVSILTATCANALETVAGVRPLVSAQSGDMFLALPAHSGHDAQVILKAMRQGMRDLAEEYPDHFHLTEHSA